MRNLRSIVLMVMAMAGFAVEDTFIKILSAEFSIAQILIMIGIGGSAIFAFLARLFGHKMFTAPLFTVPFVTRFFAEAFAALCFLIAISVIPLSTASTILQSVPILVTAAAALFLRQHVGARRWGATIIGFFGVVLVIQPGVAGFHWGTVLALLGAIFLAFRDLSTRVMDQEVPTSIVAAYGFFAAIFAGLLLLPFSEPLTIPTELQWLQFAATILTGVLAYAAIVASTRVGDVGAVAPFRYSRLIFVLVISVVVLEERPDKIMLLGASIIIASGIYTFMRERRMKLEFDSTG